MITMRSVCDNYVIQTTSMEHVQTSDYPFGIDSANLLIMGL